MTNDNLTVLFLNLLNETRFSSSTNVFDLNTDITISLEIKNYVNISNFSLLATFTKTTILIVLPQKSAKSYFILNNTVAPFMI